MKLSPEAYQLFQRLREEMLADGFERISDDSFYKRLENITVSVVGNAINIAYKGKSYGFIPEKEFLQMQQSMQPMLTNIRYLLLHAMQREMNGILDFFYRYYLN